MKAKIQSNPRFTPSLGAVLKSIRKEKGMSKQKVAKRAKLDIVFYDSIERGKRFVTLPIALRLAKVLSTPILEFGEFLENKNGS